MADQKNDQEQKKTLSLSLKKLELKKTVDAGQIRQSFSHGRTKSVAFEVKKKRKLDQASLEQERQQRLQSEMQEKTGLTQAELEIRMRILKEAQKEEDQTSKERSEEQKRLAEVDKKRTAELTARLEETKLSESRNKEEKISSQENQPPKHKSTPTIQENLKTKGSRKDKEGEEEGDHKTRKTLSLSKRETKQKFHHLTIEDALNDEASEGRRLSLAALKRAREKKREKSAQASDNKPIVRDVVIPETITVQELANRMAVRAGEVIKKLMDLGIIATLNQPIDGDTAELVVGEFGHTIQRVSEADVEEGLMPADDPSELKQQRPPVVTVMGHVDHGKTSLLDTIRKTDVVASEAGGITQHIGAYQVNLKSGQKITFLDTPGHAAFSEMRARGANVTDIVVLVVAADDGLKEQTIEAINHAKAAKVPIIVAINKIDKPQANPDRVRNELLSQELVVESLGGDIQCVEVSAKVGTNIDKLEEAILIQAEILELGANPNRPAIGTVIEAKVEKGRGTVATVLVQRGTLNIGDIFVAGSQWGRVRALVNDKGKQIKKAEPSVPVELFGFSGLPSPGDTFIVLQDEARARGVATYRSEKERIRKSTICRKGSLNQLLQEASGTGQKTLSLIIKGDVQGSVEAILGSLNKLVTEEVAIRVLHTGAGGINESDIALAHTANALVIGFNVRANPQARDLAAKENIEIRYYSIIYDVIDDIKKLMSGLLTPTLKEHLLGYAEIRDVFNITKVGKVAGCYVTSGEVRRGAKVRLLRDNVVIHEGTLKTLKRFKDEVREVKESYECGMAFENYNDIRAGDMIECFEIHEIAREIQ